MHESQYKQDQQDRPGSAAPLDDKTTEIEAVSNGKSGVRDDRPARGDSSMYCTACGTKNTIDANYCKQCGRRIERTASLRISEEAFAEAGSPDEQVRAYLVRAYIRYESGDLAGAVESCMKAIGVQPDSTDAHSLLSTLYEKQGEREKAIAEREIVLQLNPGSIADREKLEQLRDTALIITPRKITTSRAVHGSVLESRAGAAIAAVAVTLFVMVAGLAAVLVARSKPAAVQAQSQRSNFASLPLQQPAQAPTNQQAPVNPIAPRANFQAPITNSAPRVGSPATGDRRQSPLFAQSEDNEPVRPIPPARIQGPVGDNGYASQYANSGRLGNTGNTVHLPDNGLAPSEVGPAPGGQASPFTQGAQAQPQQPASNPAPNPNRGKIEIIVSNNPTGPGAQTGSSTQRNTDASSSSMDSRSAKRVALDYQIKGQYKLAITNYIKALDGAGDDAASIHYQIGLCYQRLDERENAVAQYAAAVAAWKEQLAAGQNTDAAARGIRAAQAGIKACQ
jgi:tetratricopeptide (TPR) repeat protein